MSGRPDLVARIREWIDRHGPMTFDRFMSMALYEPGLGYYAALAAGARGESGALADFQTSPQVHPAFGHLVARYLVNVWSALERPSPFVIVEPGAGAGELAGQVLEGLAESDAAPRVEYHAVDARCPTPSPSPAGLSWWSSLDDLRRAGVKAHCVLSNEFFDALPVHRVAWLDGMLREVYVYWGEREFVERIGDLSDEALARWVAESGSTPPEGWRGEICLRLAPTLEAIAGMIDRGVVLSIDYGHDTADLYAPEQAVGTLLAYHRHQWNDEILERVGEQDLTSHVDLGAMVRLGRRFGLEPAFLTTQRDFLRGLGLAEGVERWVAREATPGRRWQARFALAELTRSDGLGRLKVLAQQRGLDGFRL